MKNKKQQFNNTDLKNCIDNFIEGNKAALSMYRKCGFKLTGEKDGNEIIMERDLI